MKRLYTFLAVFTVSGISIFAQQQLTNASFETWDDLGSPTEEPNEWSSIKTSDASAFINSSAPQVCEQSSDAHTGSYSVKLTNKSVFGIIATGTLTNGRAHGDTNPENGYVFTDATNSDWNEEFTDKPDSLVGWYKYEPQNGDKGKVEAIIHSGNAQNPENGTAGNFIGRARFITPTSTVASWTRFSVPFNYLNSNASTHILIVLTSGDSTISKANSVAYFDDIELIYNVSSVDEINPNSVNVFQANGMICLDVSKLTFENLDWTLFDLQGREIIKENNARDKLIYINSPDQEGIYLVRFKIGNAILTKKVVVTK